MVECPLKSWWSATAGLDFSGLGSLVQELFAAGLAPSTLRTYRSASETYNRFCRENRLNPYPACDSVMCLLVAALYRKGIAGMSVKSYLAAAIRYSQVAVRLGDPQMADWPKLSCVVRGMKKKTSGRTKRPRLPITPPIMQCLLEVWERRSDPVNGQMLCVSACMCAFLVS